MNIALREHDKVVPIKGMYLVRIQTWADDVCDNHPEWFGNATSGEIMSYKKLVFQNAQFKYFADKATSFGVEGFDVELPEGILFVPEKLLIESV